MIKSKPCKECGSTWHTAMYHKPRKAIATKKRINQLGKHYDKWLATRAAWFVANPGDWSCHYCSKPLSRKMVTLDHKIPRSRAPELRYAKSNLVPCCWTCNGLKGSVAHDDYLHDCQV